MAARKLAAVFLVTHDVDGLVRFYRDTLGLAMARYEPGEGVRAAAQALSAAGVELLGPKTADNYVIFRDPEGRFVGLHQPR